MGIYAISLLVNLFKFPHDESRLFATINTFISLLFYCIYSNVELEAKRIGKYSFINSVVS